MFVRVFPDFIRGETRIWSGWEDTMGFDFHATCARGDDVLRQLMGSVD